MDLREKLYPRVPTAPEVEEIDHVGVTDHGHNYRLHKIEDIQKELERNVWKRRVLYKKYNRALTGVNAADGVLSFVTLASGAAGIGLLTTVVAIPVVLVLEISALATGSLSILSKFVT